MLLKENEALEREMAAAVLDQAIAREKLARESDQKIDEMKVKVEKLTAELEVTQFELERSRESASTRKNVIEGLGERVAGLKQEHSALVVLYDDETALNRRSHEVVLGLNEMLLNFMTGKMRVGAVVLDTKPKQ
jgi:predicted mannosyl-3-phosphoglycerate phosphatase (HAD superfamily)